METLWQKIGSRKFLSALGAALVAIGMFMQGQIDAIALITTLSGLAIGWGAIEGSVDIARARADGDARAAAAAAVALSSS